MKPAWDQLAEAYAGSTSVLIADVDCTSEGGKEVCQQQGVSGYPTIKYYSSATGKGGETYSGGRSLGELETFVQANLEEECDAKKLEGCSDQEKDYLKKIEQNGADKWAKELVRLEGMAAQAMKDDKRQWLQNRIALLQQLLGKRERKKPKKAMPWMLIIGVSTSIVVCVLIYCCCCRSGAGPKQGKKAKKADEASLEKETDEKKDD